MSTRKDKVMKEAFAKGDSELISMLVDHKCVISDEYVLSAIRNKHVEVVKYLIEIDHDFDDVDEQKLWIAIHNDNDSIKDLLLASDNESEAIVTIKLMHAVKNMDTQKTSQLCRHKNLNIYQAFKWCCFVGNLEAIQYLYDRGIDVRTDDDIFANVACANDNVAVLEWLYEHGVDIRKNNDVFLLHSLREGHHKITTWLCGHVALQNGFLDDYYCYADLATFKAILNSIQDLDGYRILPLLSKLECVQYMVEGKIGMPDDTKFIKACICGMGKFLRKNNLECFKYINENVVSHDEKISNYIFYNQPSLDFVKYLMQTIPREKHIDDINYLNESNSCTERKILAKKSNFKILEYLCSKGLNVNVKGNPYMRVAVLENNLPLIKFLMKRGCKL